MHELAERLLRTIRKKDLLKPGDRVAVAVSGGADSVALLLLLLDLREELGIVVSVGHVNHKLRGEESDADEQFVAELSLQHGLQLHARAAPVDARGSGIEATARRLRYDFFRRLLSEGRVSKIATAHTIDDQAETVLLRILRGTGIRGLSGIYPRLPLEGDSSNSGEVVRPLLSFRRSDLESFLRERGQAWREDSSNRDLAFLRNRVRHRLMPMLKEDFGPGSVDNLADLAEIARVEEEHWETSHSEVCSEPGPLRLVSLLQLPAAAQRRLIRNWLDQNTEELSITFRLIEEVRDLACGPLGRQMELGGGYTVRRVNLGLIMEPGEARPPADYEYPLSIPGQARIAELGVRIEVMQADAANLPPSDREQFLDPARLPNQLLVRNWRAGDRFWPAHTKEAKKVKELLSGRHLTGREKKLWPVLVAEGMGLVWMRGFPVPDALRPAAGPGPVLWIRETPVP